MQNRKFIQVLVSYGNDESLIEKMTEVAFQEYNCGGTQNFDFNEEEVDRLLGKEAYVGGDLPDSIIEKIEAKQSSDIHAMLFFFFDENSFERDAEEFVQYISSLDKEKVDSVLKVLDWADWNEKWRQYYRPIEVTEKIGVYPAWEQEKYREREGAIWINPGMGFGTGTHETTFLCLKIFSDLMESLQEPQEILDLGCGSGILGIAALKLIACQVNFCDIDKNALDNCVENISLNFSDRKLEGCTVCSRERLDTTQKYDLIFANILEPVLMEELPTVNSMSKEGSHIIISGILKDQYQNIIDLYEEAGWSLNKVENKNDWYALLMHRK